MSLSHQDVQALLKVLDDSEYDELNLDLGGFTLQLRRSADGKGWQQTTAPTATAAAPVQELAAATTTAHAVEPPPSQPGLVDVRAPMVGTWYRSPKPGAEPFIGIGSALQPDTVIGIIEVMKLMSSIPARASGTVVELIAEDASFVEKGQLLLRVKPEQA
jgi:acetyl-CoA carboxylase biotin carboxyl carrier protein